ncbi:MAG TPA: DUF2802 domain-containing protein [Rhodocyclaceae bacterium]|nr:DUF2802 domain-containing protein [Rhodocyclaceae bacterium]
MQKSFAPDVFASFGVRELIIALVVLVVVYMLVVVLRMKSLSAQRRFEEIAAARYESDLVESQSPRKKAKRSAEVEVTWSVPPAGKDRVDAFYDSTPRIEPKNKYAEPPESTVTRFDQEKLTRLERELSSTREELDALRTAFAQTRDSLQAEVERLKAGQRVSPAYGDSLQMAMSGSSAEEIAARCGIARAEAELVLSLAHGAGGPGEEAGAPGRNQDQGRSGRSRYGSY